MSFSNHAIDEEKGEIRGRRERVAFEMGSQHTDQAFLLGMLARYSWNHLLV